jgi:hypothetical protein
LTRSISAVAVVGAALALAAPASTHENGPVIVIRHRTHGCHAWSLIGAAPKASLTVALERRIHLEIGNNDVMPHKLVQIGGRRVKLPEGAAMNSVGAMIEIRFPAAGVYRFTTRAGDDYAKGIKTVGEDNALRLKVVVR